jgi:HK97 family phage major capsid protein
MSKPEELLTEIKADLKRVTDDVKATAERALSQSKDAGTLTAELKATADKLLVEQTDVKAKLDKVQAKIEGLQERNAELEQRVLTSGKPGGVEKPKSMAEQVIGSDGFKAYAAAGARGTSRFSVNMALTSGSGSAGELIWSDRETAIVGIPRRTMTIRQLLTQGRTTSNLVEYARQVSRSTTARPVTEGAAKPEADYTWERDDAAVRTIAHWVHVSRQAMDDAAQLQTEIDGELRYGLELEEELQLLKGDGLNQNLAGLVGQADSYSAAFAVQDEQDIDILRLGLLQVSLNEYPADAIVLHPTNWARIELLKDGEKRYLWSNPRAPGQPGLWGLPVVVTQSMEADEFLVGAFRTAATIYDRMDAEVVISSEDRDNFIKNMLTVRAEKRLALAVKRPSAMVTGELPPPTA